MRQQRRSERIHTVVMLGWMVALAIAILIGLTGYIVVALIATGIGLEVLR